MIGYRKAYPHGYPYPNRVFLEDTPEQVYKRLLESGALGGQQRVSYKAIEAFRKALDAGQIVTDDVMKDLPEFLEKFDAGAAPLIHIDSLGPDFKQMRDLIEGSGAGTVVLSSNSGGGVSTVQPSLKMHRHGGRPVTGTMLALAGTQSLIEREARSKRVLVVDQGVGMVKSLAAAMKAMEPESYEEFANNREGRRAKAAIERRAKKRRGR